MLLRWFKRKKKADKALEETAQQDPAPEQIEKTSKAGETEKPEEETPAPQTPKQRFFVRLRNRLSSTRKAFTGRLDNLVLGKKEIDEKLLEELEEILITSDIGVQTTVALIEKVRERVERKDLTDPGELKHALQSEILAFLKAHQSRFTCPITNPMSSW